MKTDSPKKGAAKITAPCRKAAIAARPEGSSPDPETKRTIGRPFQPGDDPRRHMSGRKCADAIAFSQAFTRALADGGNPEALARLIWKRAMKGNPYAIDVVLDRLIGPVNKAAIVSNQPIFFSIRYEPDPGPDAAPMPREPEHSKILNLNSSNVPGRDPAEG